MVQPSEKLGRIVAARVLLSLEYARGRGIEVVDLRVAGGTTPAGIQNPLVHRLLTQRDGVLSLASAQLLLEGRGPLVTVRRNLLADDQAPGRVRVELHGGQVRLRGLLLDPLQGLLEA